MPFAQADPHETILAEHAELRGLLEDVDAAFREGPQTAGGGWREELLQAVKALGPRLRSHYAREEAGGLFDSLRQADPNAGHACERLQRQHGELLAAVEALAHDLERTPRDSRDALGGRVQALLDALSDHEREENALIADVFETDTGAQD
jgi:hemerythrin-like domain-containing protein